MLTADQGSELTPEAERELRKNQAARRISMKDIERDVQRQLDTIFHPTDGLRWFAAITDPGIYFDINNLQQQHIGLAETREAMAKASQSGRHCRLLRHEQGP